MARPSVYLETSIVSYLVGPFNRGNQLVAANQELTRDWWATRRGNFDLFASPVVLDEAKKGDPNLAVERLRFLGEVELLDVTPEARTLGDLFVRDAILPPKAEIDALHIAVAAINGMDYLLSWNCTHIANAFILPRIYGACWRQGYEPPFVCTPHELMEMD